MVTAKLNGATNSINSIINAQISLFPVIQTNNAIVTLNHGLSKIITIKVNSPTSTTTIAQSTGGGSSGPYGSSGGAPGTTAIPATTTTAPINKSTTVPVAVIASTTTLPSNIINTVPIAIIANTTTVPSNIITTVIKQNPKFLSILSIILLVALILGAVALYFIVRFSNKPKKEK